MENQIECLTGAQRVRRRPAVIFGSDGTEGVMAAVQMLLRVMTSECRYGYASRLIFTQYADGSMELQDNGRGLYLGSSAPEEEHIWKSKLCELLCGCAYSDQIDRTHEYSYFEENGKVPCPPYESADCDELDLCAVQYASAFMDVTVCREGLERTLHFEKGENMGGMQLRPSTAPSGTKIRFRPDDQVFTTVDLPDDWIPQQLRSLALLIPTASFLYRKEGPSAPEEQVFCYPVGMAGYLDTLRAAALSSPVYQAQIAATGKDRYNRPEYGGKIQIALCFVKDGGHTEFFHNRRTISGNSVYVRQLLSEIAHRLHWQLDIPISVELLQQHLCLTVHTTTTPYASHWTNGRRNAIRNTMIADMAQDCVKDDFSYYIKNHQDVIREIFGFTM